MLLHNDNERLKQCLLNPAAGEPILEQRHLPEEVVKLYQSLDLDIQGVDLAGMRGMLLELYSKRSYVYKRVSKRRKKDADPEEDALRVDNVNLSVIGCATPTIFQSLDTTAVGSGPRGANVTQARIRSSIRPRQCSRPCQS